jgi:hypothetical protein
VFPEDRFASPRWRLVAWVCSVAIAAQTLAVAMKPGPMMYSMPEGSLANPAGALDHVARLCRIASCAACQGACQRANAISSAIAARVRAACARKARPICRCPPVRVVCKQSVVGCFAQMRLVLLVGVSLDKEFIPHGLHLPRPLIKRSLVAKIISAVTLEAAMVGTSVLFTMSSRG